MLKLSDAEQLVAGAIVEVNQLRSFNPPVETSPASPIFGPDASMDSLGLATLLAIVEEKVADELGLDISLLSDDAMSLSESPFRTVRTLAEFLVSEISR